MSLLMWTTFIKTQGRSYHLQQPGNTFQVMIPIALKYTGKFFEMVCLNKISFVDIESDRAKQI